MLFCLILYSYGSGIYFKLFHKSPYFVFCTIWTYNNPFKYIIYLFMSSVVSDYLDGHYIVCGM